MFEPKLQTLDVKFLKVEISNLQEEVSSMKNFLGQCHRLSHFMFTLSRANILVDKTFKNEIVNN